jgi:carbamoyl-phosphate synthase large subunit
MRDAAIRIIRKVGVETGGSNIQFAVSPKDGSLRVIEMNPRVSRSSALASKATGFPIAKIAAKLAVGYTLDEIPNDITRKTPASFEPTIDYVVVKIPKWAFEKFPGVDAVLGTQMKSVGEAMAIGRTFKEAFLKGVRSLEHRGSVYVGNVDDETLRRKLILPNAERIHYLHAAFERNWTVDELYELTGIDPWFLTQLNQITDLQQTIAQEDLESLPDSVLRTAKRYGFSDVRLAELLNTTEDALRARRRMPEYARSGKRVDTCGGGVRVIHALPVFGLTRERMQADPHRKIS